MIIKQRAEDEVNLGGAEQNRKQSKFPAGLNMMSTIARINIVSVADLSYQRQRRKRRSIKTLLSAARPSQIQTCE